mmetsp:Transcript_33929/g.62108  ORF Transcript_33929/g.62108 Transcript_33929/m.62108 type:complete len:389 (+) Transcript_33929:451-1617(+)
MANCLRCCSRRHKVESLALRTCCTTASCRSLSALVRASNGISSMLTSTSGSEAARDQSVSAAACSSGKARTKASIASGLKPARSAAWICAATSSMPSAMPQRMSRSRPKMACFNDSRDAKCERKPSNSARASRSASAHRCRTMALWLSIDCTAAIMSSLRGSSSLCSNALSACNFPWKSRRKATITRSSVGPLPLSSCGWKGNNSAFCACTDLETIGTFSVGNGPADGRTGEGERALAGQAWAGDATADKTMSRISFCQSSICCVFELPPARGAGRDAAGGDIPVAASWVPRACGALPSVGSAGSGEGAVPAVVALLAGPLCAAARLVSALAICDSTSALTSCCCEVSRPARTGLAAGDAARARCAAAARLDAAGSAKMRPAPLPTGA